MCFVFFATSFAIKLMKRGTNGSMGVGISGDESLVFGGDKVDYILQIIHKVYRRSVTSLRLYINMCANVMREHSANTECVSMESAE